MAGKINQPYTGQELVETLKVIEGLPSKKQAPTPYSPYQDAAGNWTIGYGHKMSEEEVKKYAGKSITPEEAEALLKKDIIEHQTPWLDKVEIPLTKNQVSALTSYAYHAGAYKGMEAIVARINAGDWDGVAQEMKLRGSKMTVTDKETGEKKKILVDSFVQRREWEISRLNKGDELSDLKQSYDSRKGVVQKVFDWFRTPQKKSWDRPEFDTDTVLSTNKATLKGLEDLCAKMNANRIPFDIDEISWTRKTIMEGSGGTHG